MKESILRTKSFNFALRIVNLSKILIAERKEYILSKQLIRSGTSIGANIREAGFAQSKADFVHKLSISLKEAAETEYWLELLYRADFITEKEFISIDADVKELLKMLIASINSAKK